MMSVRSPALARSLLVMLAICSFSMPAIAQSERIQLPDIGNSAQTVMSPRFEKEYGEALLRQMRQFDVLVEDPQISAFFTDLGYRLVAQSNRPDKHFTFVVIKEGNINAFAAPGGVVALNSGLILAADNESEVAGVLAHEVAHVTQLHLARAVENAQSVSIPAMLAMLGLILAGGGGADVIQGAVMSSQAFMAQNQINFTRENEHEADRLGIQTLSKAGYDPMGMASFFGKLGRVTRSNGEGPPEYLRTHPLSVTRVAEASNRAAKLPQPDLAPNLEFRLMQARLRALQEEYAGDAVRYFTHQLETVEFTPVNLASNQYGLALANKRNNQPEAAQELLDKLLAADPDRLAYRILNAELLMDQRDYAGAVASLDDLYHQFPGNHVIAVHRVRGLLAQADEASALEAREILREQLLNHGDEPGLQDLVAQAALLSGDTVASGEAVAESHYLRGRLHEAVLRLRSLTKEEDLDYYQRARITARLSELEILLGEQARGQSPS